MPNYGRTDRCLTCKRRRVKCDEARPACSPCRRLGLDCGGYSKQYSFRDQGYRFASAATVKTSKGQDASVQRSAAAGEPSRSLLTGADVAIPFWLVHYAGMGRRLAAARGFYETLIPTYTSQPHDSPLSLAVSAVAARVLSIWRHEDAVQVKFHLASYTQAVASLRSVLECPEDRRKPATALAVLALHLYESISAVYDAREAAPVHHHGALSLLPAAALDSLDGLVGTYVKGFVLHSEISSALRQKRPMHPNAYSYMNSPHVSSLVPGNFSTPLDSIGASVAELQADYVRGLSQRQVSGTLTKQQCRAWIAEAEQIDELLRAWAQDVPNHWRPLRLTSGQDFSQSIPAYRSVCDIYPSCQIATLWNLWRFHRLLLLKITVGATHISILPPGESACDERPLPTNIESVIQAGSIQELVDSICYSVPFYLGNRTKQINLSDFTDPEILFPSYHSLPPGDARSAARDQDGGDVALSADEHRRHIVAYGAWHIMSPLSNLLTLFSDDHGGRLVASCLRPGQQEWICEQFSRLSTLVRLPAAGPFGGEKGHGQSLLPVDSKSADGAVESLAKQVRKGAVFMSGP